MTGRRSCICQLRTNWRGLRVWTTWRGWPSFRKASMAGRSSSVSVFIASSRKQHAEEELRILGRLLGAHVSSDVQLAAVKALGRMRDERVVGVLTREWGSFGPALRGAVLDQVLAR